jgi:sugar transferase EpsL
MSMGTMWNVGAKRLFDLLSSIVLLVVLGPSMLVLAGLVRWRMGSPVLFRQQRAGLAGHPFTIFKFRTMTDARDAHGNLLAEEKRLTRLGSLLRSTSLDELPELLNVIKGEMSLVGPRPLHVRYLDRYTTEQGRRHEVKPGITGWAQVHGRNAITWEEKFRLDVWYVDNHRLGLDLQILCRTLVQALKREGISAEGYATMPEFMGSSQARAGTGQGSEEEE